MLIGAMNHPLRDPVLEMDWMGRLELDFIDLTLEPPAASSEKVSPAALCEGLERNRLSVVGHTAFYLPIASPFEKLRAAAMDEMKHCIDVFAEVGALWVNVHPDPHMHFHTEEEMREQNLKSMRELMNYAQSRGTGLMVENTPKRFNSVAQLSSLLDPLPELGLHLDIGHANLEVKENTTSELVAHYGPRIRHVHVHDNKGGSADLHLPLGAGTIDFRQELGALKSSGYDGTITLEVFSRDTHYFTYSRDVLCELWGAL
jgi:sugar phosphate isomerase/epimerase